jgi:hypothetical protein
VFGPHPSVLFEFGNAGSSSVLPPVVTALP